MTCGIYKLNFKGTPKVYIGKSKNIETRVYQHIKKLYDGSHTNKMMLAYKEFGIPTLDILIECAALDLNSNENEAIEIFDAVDNGFNTLRTAEDMPDGSSNFGELNGRSKYSNAQVIQAFKMLIDTDSNSSLKYISEITGISYEVIRYISKGRSHTWLGDSFPEEYEQLLKLKNTRNSAKGRGILYPNITSPEGVIYTVHNTNIFAKEHNLHQSGLCEVLNGTRKTCKGWYIA